MDKQEINYGVIMEFISINQLKDRNSNVVFNCEYTVDGNSFHSSECEARIYDDVDGTGQLVLQKIEFNSREYPTHFMARFQDYELDGNDLVIRGTMRPPSTLGKYEARIQSLGIVTDFE